MSLNHFMAKFSNIGQQIFLRCDPKYRRFWDIKNGHVLTNDGEGIALKDILSPMPKQVLKKGLLPEECILLGIDTSEPRDGQLRNLPIISEIGSNKLVLKDADLIITKLGSTRGYVFDNTLKGKNLIGSTELIPYLFINQSNVAAFLKYLLLLPAYLYAYAHLESGKTPSHWRVNPLDLLRVKIPEIPRKTQVAVLREVEPIQQRINMLKAGLDDPVHIINRVFAREFGYSEIEYEKRACQDNYQLDFSNIAQSSLMRSTVKFHHPKYDYLNEILSAHPYLKLKELCSERIRRGVQPKYDPYGEVLVVKTLNLKHECLDFSESERVSLDFFKDNLVAAIEEGDILVSSTGEGRGKVDIYNIEEPAMADSHVSIICLMKNVDPYYVLYFMRSLLGKMQLDTLEIAVKGTPEIYWFMLEQMRIIEVSTAKRDRIIDEIKGELNALQEQKEEIQKIRNQIDEIFMEVLKR